MHLLPFLRPHWIRVLLLTVLTLLGALSATLPPALTRTILDRAIPDRNAQLLLTCATLERGVQLCGGQRQRLEIVRSLVYDPAVLILDEATSALDGDTEARVMENLRARFLGRTIIIIAHRLSTVAGADRILVLQDGRVAEQGTHQELLTRGGIYGSLYAQEA